MVDTSMKVHHTSVGVGRVCGLSPSEWGLPAKVFCFASIFVNKRMDVLAIFDIFQNHVMLILKTSRWVGDETEISQFPLVFRDVAILQQLLWKMYKFHSFLNIAIIINAFPDYNSLRGKLLPSEDGKVRASIFLSQTNNNICNTRSLHYSLVRQEFESLWIVVALIGTVGDFCISCILFNADLLWETHLPCICCNKL